MSKTYGDFPGVKVETDASLGRSLPDLSTEENYRCLICIQATKGIWSEDGLLKVNLHAACGAMRCFGHNFFHAMPMLKAALTRLGEECKNQKI